MEDKEQTQAVEEQAEETTNQPTVDELLAQIEEKNKEIERKETVIQQTKADNKRLQRISGSRAEIEALSKKIDASQEQIAEWLDDFQKSDYEEPRQRKSYKEELHASRAKKETPQYDPAAQRFFDYLAEENLDFEDDMVQEAIKDTQTPQQALKAIKDKVKSMEQTEKEKQAQEKDKEMEQKIQQQVEQRLKDMGLTATGAGQPSASARGFAKAEQDYADGKISYTEYKKARQEEGLLS